MKNQIWHLSPHIFMELIQVQLLIVYSGWINTLNALVYNTWKVVLSHFWSGWQVKKLLYTLIYSRSELQCILYKCFAICLQFNQKKNVDMHLEKSIFLSYNNHEISFKHLPQVNYIQTCFSFGVVPIRVNIFRDSSQKFQALSAINSCT